MHVECKLVAALRGGEREKNNNESRLVKYLRKEWFFFGGFQNEKRNPIKQFDERRMRPETRNNDLMRDNLGWRRKKSAKGKTIKENAIERHMGDCYIRTGYV